MKRNRLVLILILGLLTAFGPLSVDMYLPALPTLATEFGASVASVQGTLTTFFIGFALGQVFYGPVSDRFGRKPPLYVGLSFFVLASLACAASPNIAVLAGLRFLQALGACSGIVMARAIVRDAFPPEGMRRITATLMLVTGFAPMLAPLIGGYILVSFGWQAIFILLALIGAFALLAVHFLFEESYVAEPGQQLALGRALQRYAYLLSDKEFFVHALLAGFGLSSLFAYIAGSPFVFIEYFQIPAQHYAWIFGINSLGIVVASQISGRLLAGVAPARILRFATLAQALFGLTLLAVALLAPTLWSISLPLFMYIFASFFVLPNAVVLALVPHGKNAGSASALIGIMQFGFGAVTSTAVGLFEKISKGAVPMTAVIAACALCSAGIYAGYRRQIRRERLLIQRGDGGN